VSCAFPPEPRVYSVLIPLYTKARKPLIAGLRHDASSDLGKPSVMYALLDSTIETTDAEGFHVRSISDAIGLALRVLSLGRVVFEWITYSIASSHP
jgi:hypothetical protein